MLKNTLENIFYISVLEKIDTFSISINYSNKNKKLLSDKLSDLSYLRKNVVINEPVVNIPTLADCTQGTTPVSIQFLNFRPGFCIMHYRKDTTKFSNLYSIAQSGWIYFANCFIYLKIRGDISLVYTCLKINWSYSYSITRAQKRMWIILVHVNVINNKKSIDDL